MLNVHKGLLFYCYFEWNCLIFELKLCSIKPNVGISVATGTLVSTSTDTQSTQSHQAFQRVRRNIGAGVSENLALRVINSSESETLTHL